MVNSKKSTIYNIIRVTVSNLTTIVSGIIIGFIIPKVMSVEGYGYYKTFTLYAAYVGVFSLGLIDGIVLKYGGCDYDQLDRSTFRSIFRWYIIIHLMWMLVILAGALIFAKGEYRFIAIIFAFYMIASNIVGYYQQISQITQRFKEYSIVKTVQSILKICGGFVLVLLFIATNDLVDYKIYIILLSVSLLLLTLIYSYIYRDIIFGTSLKLSRTKLDVFELIRIGFPLLIANLCGTLILSLDRQFVNVLFPNEEYAIYAFAYNMLSLVTVATTAISTVLYPMMKRASKKKLAENYGNLLAIILVFIYCALSVYFPLGEFIQWFLPKYNSSLIILRVIFPGLVISSAIEVIMHNYYKTFDYNLLYFKRSIFILALATISNMIAYCIFGTTISISIASIITMIAWFLYVESLFINKFGYKRSRNLLYLLVMMFSFYISTSLDNWINGMIIYLLLWILVSSVFFKKSFWKMKSIVIR